MWLANLTSKKCKSFMWPVPALYEGYIELFLRAYGASQRHTYQLITTCMMKPEDHA